MPSRIAICPCCKNVLSVTAETCPKCGHRMKRSAAGWILILALVLIGGFIVLGILGSAASDLSAAAGG